MVENSAIIFNIITLLYIAALIYILILDLGYILLLITSIPNIFNDFRETYAGTILTFVKKFPMSPITVIIPVYNGEDSVLDAIYSVLKCEYNKFVTIIVVNDGSTDGTVYTIAKEFELYECSANMPDLLPVRSKVRAQYFSKNVPNIILIDKENGGKSDALNCALNICHTPLFITLDDDTLLEPDTIQHLLLNFFYQDHTVSIGGTVYVLNGCTHANGVIKSMQVPNKLVPLTQSVEYLRSFLYGRIAWRPIGGSLCYSGTLTLFETSAVLEVGGFDYLNHSQDFEIITHLQSYRKQKHYPWHIDFAPSAAAWTNVPRTLTALWRQRTKWQIGSLKSMFSHMYMCFNPKYGAVGLLTFPFFLFGELLGPIVIFTAYSTGIVAYNLHLMDLSWLLLIFLISVGLDLCLTLTTIILSFFTYKKYSTISDFIKLICGVIVECLFIHQFLIVCQVIATFKFILQRFQRNE